MLKLKKRIQFPAIQLTTPVVVFSAIASEDDELIQAIEHDAERRDDTWQLTRAPDTVELESFWSRVVDDLRTDSEWQSMSID